MDSAGKSELMIFRRVFTAIGVGLIVGGIFMPFLAVPIFHDDSFRELTPQGTWIVLGLAALSGLCILCRRFGVLYITGLATMGLVLYTIYEVNTRKAEYLSDFNEALAGSPLKGLGISFVKSVDITHGAALMLAGAIVLVCVPLLGSRVRRRRAATTDP